MAAILSKCRDACHSAGVKSQRDSDFDAEALTQHADPKGGIHLEDYMMSQQTEHLPPYKPENECKYMHIGSQRVDSRESKKSGKTRTCKGLNEIKMKAFLSLSGLHCCRSDDNEEPNKLCLSLY